MYGVWVDGSEQPNPMGDADAKLVMIKRGALRVVYAAPKSDRGYSLHR